MSEEIVSRGRDYSNVNSFLEMGEVLFHDPKAGLTIRQGQIFECPTVKGGKNLIVTMRNVNGWMIYIHGDKARKTSMEVFVRAVMNGDIEPKMPNEVDAGRMSMAMIGIDAIANRRTGEETINAYEEAAFLRHRDGK